MGIGFVVIIVIAGVIWLRRDKARISFTEDSLTTATASEPDYQLTMGAITWWSCGHEVTLSRPLDPGVTVATAPCPLCGHPGIVGQYVAGQYVEYRC